MSSETFPTIVVDANLHQLNPNLNINVDAIGIADYMRSDGMDDTAIIDTTIHFVSDFTPEDLHKLRLSSEESINVMGYYDPGAKSIYVKVLEDASYGIYEYNQSRKRRVTDEMNSDLVHEITHRSFHAGGRKHHEYSRTLLPKAIGAILIPAGTAEQIAEAATHSPAASVAAALIAAAGGVYWSIKMMHQEIERVREADHEDCYDAGNSNKEAFVSIANRLYFR